MTERCEGGTEPIPVSWRCTLHKGHSGECQLDRPEPTWVSVSERLPEKRRDVLVCSHGHITVGWVGDSERWYTYCTADTCWQHVTHWQELPELPEIKV